MPHSAACGATSSLLMEPTHGFLISDLAFGATLTYAVLGICQNMSSGILHDSTKKKEDHAGINIMGNIIMMGKKKTCFPPE